MTARGDDFFFVQNIFLHSDSGIVLLYDYSVLFLLKRALRSAVVTHGQCNLDIPRIRCLSETNCLRDFAEHFRHKMAVVVIIFCRPQSGFLGPLIIILANVGAQAELGRVCRCF